MPALVSVWYLPAPAIQTAWVGPISGTREPFPTDLDPGQIPTVIGPTGPIGATGPAGAQGNAGNAGPQGVAGNTGAVGPAGPIGADGPAGLQGPAGNNGTDGAQGAQGPQGIQGIQGPTGPAGAQGPQGIQGPAGTVSGNADSATVLQTSRNFSISGGGITAATVGFDGSVAVVLNASVDVGHITLAKMADMATASLIYRKTAGIGAPEVQTLATLKTDLGLSGTNTGDQTDVTGNAGSATALQTGRTIGMTGDVVWTSPSFNGTANVTAAATLATVNANVGTFGSSTLVPVVTVNAKGLVTAVSEVAVLRERVSVFDFLTLAEIADVISGTGAIDVSPKIQTAIDSLQNGAGGTLFFPNGKYYIATGLVIGNASTSGVSFNTKAPVRLAGDGPVSGVGYASPDKCAVIKSNVAGAAFFFDGPLGWGLEDFAFTFTTTSTAAQAVNMVDVESGTMRGIVVLNCPGMEHMRFYSSGAKNLAHNQFSDIYIYMGSSPANAVGAKLGALGSGSTDVAINTFTNLHIQPGLASHGGLKIGYADTNTFIRYSCNPLPGFLPCAFAINFDYAEAAGSVFPNSNHFFGGTPYTNPVISTGTPGFSSALHNAWAGFEIGNNCPVPTAQGFVVERMKLTANATFYVNPNAGAGSGSFGPGRADSFGIYIGNPCLTVQQAYDQICTHFDLNGFTATISGADGTYTSGIVTAKLPVGGRVIFTGQGGGSAFTGTSTPFVSNDGGDLEVRSVNFSLGASVPCVKADGGTLRVGTGLVFNTNGSEHIQGNNGGKIIFAGNYFVLAGGAAHLSCRSGATASGTAQMALLGNVSITEYAKATTMGSINAAGLTFSLGAFAVTGTRYAASVNGVIDTNGGGASFFPGTIAGTTATGGQYA